MATLPLISFPTTSSLRNTTIFYLPPNATLKIQPCDAGIIRSFKAYYRRRFNRLLLQRLEDNVVNPKKIDILCAIQMAVRAWTYEVKPKIIFNYFHHCKICSIEEPVVDASEECPLDPEVIEDLESQIVMGFQNCESLNFKNFKTPTWESRDKMTFGC